MNGICGTEAAPTPRLPEWLRKTLAPARVAEQTDQIVADLGLNTICQSGRCPNRNECFANKTASFMILGERCTRRCHYCSVTTRKPLPPDKEEPNRLAEAIGRLQLKHAVITSVTRDDLPDEGVSHFDRVTRTLRERFPDLIIEILTPDFRRNPSAAAQALAQMPIDIFNHNIETVRTIHSQVRPQGSYAGSLALIELVRKATQNRLLLKSGIMLGLGETEVEIRETLKDLLASGVRLLTVGQYLRPSKECWAVKRFVTPAEFDTWRDEALGMGFWVVESGPFVRSSYHAEGTLKRLRSLLSTAR